ncbi:SDR family oxidoreductase [Jatrophihabitans sp.]|uniref:SDR family oxidoreductase n=1 Tax=Jatrophihabitans sp. TaxID=1932789 RepID=UPI002B6099C2|nr:SDR family oxidoreductase [Jatrophihabitans sp.]
MTARQATVLVTGASRGIGAQTALRLAAAGFDLVLWARTLDELQLVGEKAAAYGTDVSVRAVDVSDADQVAAGYLAIDWQSPLTGLVLNAGSGIWQRIAEIDDAVWDRTLATNLRGSMLVLRQFLPPLQARPGGLVVGVLSDSARYPFPGRAAYAASKAGLAALLEVARREARNAGVRITALLPSRVDTAFQGSLPSAAAGCRPGSLSADEVAEVIGWLFELPAGVEVRELQLAALTSSFGPYDEVLSREEPS